MQFHTGEQVRLSNGSMTEARRQLTRLGIAFSSGQPSANSSVLDYATVSQEDSASLCIGKSSEKLPAEFILVFEQRCRC
jgi:hypothetical protein